MRLFLSKADRGEQARRSLIGSLAALAAEVVEVPRCGPCRRRVSAFAFAGTAAVPSMRVCCGGPCRTSSPTRRGLRSADQRSIWTSSSTNLGVRLSVSNVGPEIPVEHLPRLFDRFYRADRAREHGDANHGLSLAIVAAIARMHGGDAFVRSSAGKTTVGFSLSAVSISA